jgi:hypothetical protein
MHALTRSVGIAAMLTTLPLVSNHAAAAHFFVSPFGNDGGTGTAFAPFLTLQGAVNAASSGDVIQLEMGGSYGAAVINDKTLTILSTQAGGVYEAGVTGIIFNGSGGNDELTIRGLTIDQAGTPNNGITFNSGRKLNVFDAFIGDSSGAASGIFYQPNDVLSELNIRNTVIGQTGTALPAAGIRIAPRAGGDVDAMLEDVFADNNRVAVSVVAGTNSAVDVTIDGLTASGNGTAITSNGAGSTVRVKNSTIANNTTGISHPGTAKLISLGGNSVRGNTTNGTFTATEPQQ